MKICKVWDAEYPWDVRTEKVARALTEAGHEVHLVARNRDGRIPTERLEECTVHRLKPIPGLSGLPGIGRRIDSAAMFPAFFNPRWIGKIHRTARETGAEVILCRDLPLAPSAVWVGRRLGLPVVLDMAENYPAMIRSVWENGRHRWSDWLVRNPRAVEAVERWTLDNIDHILVVVEESRDRLIRLGVASDRITVVSNTPPRARATESRQDGRKGGADGPLELVYLGLLEAPRGIATLIDAVGLCAEAGVDLRLSLIGDGRERGDFEARARAIDPAGTRIRFLGYVPNAEALRRLREADAGVIPHHADESWNTTIPNKLFDYMAAGLPVIASDAPPVRRIVEETRCGLVFRDRDAGDLARVLGQLAREPDPRRYGDAGRSAVERRYNWEMDASRLLEAIDRIAFPRREGLTLEAVGGS